MNNEVIDGKTALLGACAVRCCSGTFASEIVGDTTDSHPGALER